MKREPISPYFDIKQDAEGREYMEVYLEGIALLRLVLSNKGTAFTEDERVALGLDGLLPPQVNTLEQQVARVYRGFLREPDPIAKYQYLRALQERAETLFYALLEQHLEEMMPIIYTPTVGQAVQQFSHLYQNPRGLSFSSPVSTYVGQAEVHRPQCTQSRNRSYGMDCPAERCDVASRSDMPK